MHDSNFSQHFQVDHDPWVALRDYTPARIALGRTGASIPLHEALNFKLAHAHARDAIYSVLDLARLRNDLEIFELPVYHLQSRVRNRQEYLKRPDLGRNLNEASRRILQGQPENVSYDVSIILADGLSASAVNDHAVNILRTLIPFFRSSGLRIAPLTIAEQARVAICDEIGWVLRAQLVVILIGERPGLTSPNSLGAYLTYAPVAGLTDESRNCISNIRPEGLNYKHASKKIFYLAQESLRRKLSGVHLKDNAHLID